VIPQNIRHPEKLGWWYCRSPTSSSLVRSSQFQFSQRLTLIWSSRIWICQVFYITGTHGMGSLTNKNLLCARNPNSWDWVRNKNFELIETDTRPRQQVDRSRDRLITEITSLALGLTNWPAAKEFVSKDRKSPNGFKQILRWLENVWPRT